MIQPCLRIYTLAPAEPQEPAHAARTCREAEGAGWQARANSRPNKRFPASISAVTPSDASSSLALKAMPSTRLPSHLTPTTMLALAQQALDRALPRADSGQGRRGPVPLLRPLVVAKCLIVRVFSSVISAHVAFRLVWLWHVFSSAKKRAVALEARHEARMSVGLHPFRKVWNYASGMTVDAARFRLALATFPNFFRCVGWVLLAGGSALAPTTHYDFIREIPMLSRSELRAFIGAWDEKWIWVISRFVTTASASASSPSKCTSPADAKSSSFQHSPAGNANPHVPTLKTPATPLLTPGTGTPFMLGGGDGDAPEPDAVAKALLARGSRD
ncbi:hypothetical protein FB451DRAFT_1478925 [Mycena latifolia]|nr:hypothetical protein FB451DRAFT_1478925 [Mycena latifolia]